jgi:hypothetical protein
MLHCRFAFPPGKALLATRHGERALSGIELLVTYRLEAKPVQPRSFLRYEDPAQPIAAPIIEVMQGEASLDDMSSVRVNVFFNRVRPTQF